jgi:LuxR family maltose regulon positive regulatory protein
MSAPDKRQAYPALPRTYVVRKRLWEQLDESDAGAVTLLVAPAGAGKTLGVSGWLRLHGRADGPDPRVAWVRADAGWTAERLRALLDQAAAGDGRRPGLVVVDDAHRLPAGALSLVDHRLRHDPACLHVLLMSRWNLPLHQLVPELLGHLTVLRGDLLRMTEDESAALIAGHARTASAAVVSAIGDRAQGWCAALVLMARAVGAAGDPVAAAGAHRSGAEVSRIAGELFAGLADRERHLLLCTVDEPVVTAAVAVHLTRDNRAGEALAELAATGLLVSRLAGPGPDEFRTHPLLTEVVRRRLATGGPDADRARAAVRRAVRLDLARGDGDRAFARLVAVGDARGAVRLLEREGLAMVFRGEGKQIADFVERHPGAVEGTDAAWFTVATERWADNDLSAARHWMDRLLEAPAGAGDEAEARLACVRLMRARLGLEPTADAVRNARRLAAELPYRPAAQAVLPHLLFELAVTQNWTGDLDEAEIHLGAVLGLCRSRPLPALRTSALSHLALTQYMQGRERAGVEVATVTLAALGESRARHDRFSSPRASLALQLGRLSEPPGPVAPPGRVPAPVHAADLCTTFWLAVRDVCRTLRLGSVADAEAVLESPLSLPEQFGVTTARALPAHLVRAWLVHRVLLAALAADRRRLAETAGELRRLGDLGEAALAEGFRLDLAGDRRGAHRWFSVAAEQSRCPQPPAAVVAMVCAAQLRDALGDPVGAADGLRHAVAMTEVRRTAVPFLGWTRHGTPIGVLLDRLTGTSPWLTTLARSTAGATDAVRRYARTAMSPALSPRERDVLHDLAQGATYADIAANRFIAESTVKTHISSLYAKLGASRRSEALATARRMRLL